MLARLRWLVRSSDYLSALIAWEPGGLTAFAFVAGIVAYTSATVDTSLRRGSSHSSQAGSARRGTTCLTTTGGC